MKYNISDKKKKEYDLCLFINKNYVYVFIYFSHRLIWLTAQNRTLEVLALTILWN